MKIWKQFHKYKKRDLWFARFRLNKKEFTPSAETKSDLLDLIAEIRNQEKAEIEKQKYNLNREVVYFIPTVADLLEEVKPTIRKEHQRTLTKRVFENFNSVIPTGLKVNELKTFHYELYIRHRQTQISKITGQVVSLSTIYKELYAVTTAIKDGSKLYEGLTEWQMPKLPLLPKGFKKKAERQRVVTEDEINTVIKELSKPPQGRVTVLHYAHRLQLAHILEFGLLTGLRRKEIAALKFSQFDSEENVLRNVKRFKTDSITKIFPLENRAVEIINERRKIQNDSDYIFSENGTPPAAAYRTLREVCKKLNITYGRYTDGGFIPHDLRHNFASEIVQTSDIETARELLGHANINQTQTYIHTNEQRLKDAIKSKERRKQKIDYDSELKEIFESVKKDEIDLLKFAEKVKNLFGF